MFRQALNRVAKRAVLPRMGSVSRQISKYTRSDISRQISVSGTPSHTLAMPTRMVDTSYLRTTTRSFSAFRPSEESAALRSREMKIAEHYLEKTKSTPSSAYARSIYLREKGLTRNEIREAVKRIIPEKLAEYEDALTKVPNFVSVEPPEYSQSTLIRNGVIGALCVLFVAAVYMRSVNTINTDDFENPAVQALQEELDREYADRLKEQELSQKSGDDK